MIDTMVATEPGVEYAPLFYKPLEKIKEINLRKGKGNFDNLMRISRDSKMCYSVVVNKS